MSLHAFIHRYAPWICPYCGAKWCVVLLLCGCASERPTQRSENTNQLLIRDKLVLRAPLPVAVEHERWAINHLRDHAILLSSFPKGYPKGVEPLPPGSQPGMRNRYTTDTINKWGLGTFVRRPRFQSRYAMRVNWLGASLGASSLFCTTRCHSCR